MLIKKILPAGIKNPYNKKFQNKPYVAISTCASLTNHTRTIVQIYGRKPKCLFKQSDFFMSEVLKTVIKKTIKTPVVS